MKETPEFRRKYGSERRVKTIQALPCEVCGARPSENAHCPDKGSGSGTRDRGMGRKAGWQTIVPLCRTCHDLRDRKCGSNSAFFAETNVDLRMAAAYFARRIDQDGNDSERDL